MLMSTVVAFAALTVPHRFWPIFPRPQVVLTVASVPTPDHAVLLQTLAGLSARPDPRNSPREVIWVPAGHPEYVRLYESMVRRTGARVSGPHSVWSLADRFRARGMLRGYILYRRDTSARPLHAEGPADVSVNVATSLCAPLNAVAVSEELEQEAQRHGLTRLLDARNLTEEQCFTEYQHSFSRRVLALIDPKVAAIRMEAVAMGAMVLCRPGPLYERALAWLEPGSPILGWGLGDEFLQTEPASRWAHFQTATNWCANLPILATEPVTPSLARTWRKAANRRVIWELPWEQDVHYAAFVMTDGDNVQWLMGNFLGGEEDSWWASPARGRFPMGWTACQADLAQLSPYTLGRLASTAKPNDDLVLYGGGYYYPDLFGKSRPGPTDWLRQHAERIAPYMRLAGSRAFAVNCARWDGAEARRAYALYARKLPNLAGVLAVQYAPYTAGAGRVLWFPNAQGAPIPVVSARFALWSHTNTPQDGSPAIIAERLNALPSAGPPETEDRFTWITVHCWSYFMEPSRERTGPPEDPYTEQVDQAAARERGARRGLWPVLWCRERLAPHVRVVTPTDLLLLMRLRTRPGETLQAELAALARLGGGSAFRAALAQAERLLRAGRHAEAFAMGSRAWNLAGRPRP